MSEFENLKIHDYVIVNGRYAKEVKKVKRLTKTQIIICDLSGHIKRETKYRKQTGDLVGGNDYFSNHITIPKDGEIKKIKEDEKTKRMVAAIQNINWNSVSPKDLEAVYNIMKKPKEKNDNKN